MASSAEGPIANPNSRIEECSQPPMPFGTFVHLGLHGASYRVVAVGLMIGMSGCSSTSARLEGAWRVREARIIFWPLGFLPGPVSPMNEFAGRLLVFNADSQIDWRRTTILNGEDQFRRVDEQGQILLSIGGEDLRYTEPRFNYTPTSSMVEFVALDDAAKKLMPKIRISAELVRRNDLRMKWEVYWPMGMPFIQEALLGLDRVPPNEEHGTSIPTGNINPTATQPAAR